MENRVLRGDGAAALSFSKFSARLQTMREKELVQSFHPTIRPCVSENQDMLCLLEVV
ncbi:hypothetical protein HYW32_02250 [Candidatus Berkelbacteria bacterium]|nr:hypothetical protein [Candidatus Berkelbacteria bacterium]